VIAFDAVDPLNEGFRRWRSSPRLRPGDVLHLAPTERTAALTQMTSDLSGRQAHPLHALDSTPGETGITTDHRGLVRMALDLHDGPIQDLAALGFTIGRLQQTLQEIEAKTARAAGELAELQGQLGTVEIALRTVATSDDPALESSTVIELIDKETVAFKARSRASLEIRVVGDVEPETASQRIALHRVLRECLSNVARHSQAENVRISLVDAGGAIELSVMDDGVGFDPGASTDPGMERVRLGLSGMQHRLELLDGTLSVESQVGGPTTVKATIKRWKPHQPPRAAA
jgi:signal transduction histidine kinase